MISEKSPVILPEAMGQCASLVHQLSKPAALDFSAEGLTLRDQFMNCLNACFFVLTGLIAGTACAVAWHELAHLTTAWALALYPDTYSAAFAAFGK